MDETLIQSLFLTGAEYELDFHTDIDYKDWVLTTGVAYSYSRDDIRTYLRPYALEFLKKLRETYAHVFMMTAASYDYACGCNEEMGLGFKTQHIIAREVYWNKILAWSQDAMVKEDCEHILIDNEPLASDLTRTKMRYLNKYGTADFIPIAPFNIRHGSLKEDIFPHSKGQFDRILNELKNN